MLAVRLVKFLSPYAGVGTHEKVASSHDLAVLTLLRGSMCGRDHWMDHSYYSCGSSVCAISPMLQECVLVAAAGRRQSACLKRMRCKLNCSHDVRG